MGDPTSEQGFGDPASVATGGDAARTATGELDRLTDLVNRDVRATVPDLWGGEAATAFQQTWYRLAASIAGLGSPLDTYGQWLAAAADSMRRARQQLEHAKQFAAANGLYIRPDLVVAAYDPSRPGVAALIAVAQQHVDLARRMAGEAQRQIRAANEMLEREGQRAAQELSEIAGVLAGGGARRGQGRPRRPPVNRNRADEDNGLLYGPEGRIRLPAPDRGTWSGVPGDSRWTPHRAGDYGLLPGQSIRWREGVPDLREHAVPQGFMPDGRTATLEGLRLTGDHRADRLLGDAALARRFGWTEDQVAGWRRDNDYVYHHYSRHELQLVPGRIHRSLPHQGSASELP